MNNNTVFLCFILSIISSFCILQNENSIQITGYDIKIKLGELKSSLSTIVIQIDLRLPFTHFFIEHFPSRLVSEIQFNNSPITYNLPYTNLDLQLKTAKLNPFLLCDIQTVIPDYNFIIIDKYIIQDHHVIQPYVSSSLSLAHSFIDYEYNLIDILYQNNVITKRAFSIVQSKYDRPMLYLGYVPYKNIITNYKGKCSVNKNSVEWKCLLNKIHIKLNNHEWFYTINNDTNKESIAFFQTTEKKILVPDVFYKRLKQEIFDELLEEEICFMREKNKEFVCRYNSFKEYNIKMFFVFEEVSFVFGMNELFEKIDDRLSRFIIYKNEFNNYNEWVFGTAFMKHMTMVFDYDKSVVEFYSDYIEIIQKQNNIIKLFYYEICLLLFGVMLVLYVFTYNHKYN